MIPGYTILAELHRGRKRIVYRGQRRADGVPVIIKTLNEEFPAAADVAALKREYDLLRSVQIEGIARAHAFEQLSPNPALILEDIGGEPLRHLIDARRVELGFFFEIALQLAEILGRVHQHNIIHKDIAPKNIVVNLETRRVQLIDFSISSLLPHESQKISHPNVLEGTLAYMSPEQTGRMNRAIDYRTDFYSLGATFYEMLTGSLPFASTDPLELVHAHIAKLPTPPHGLNAKVPQALSDVVMKLLAKTAEARYQSARGLHADLEACRAAGQGRGIIEGFVAGQRDFSDRFQIPQKLYGRENEIAILMSAFARVSAGTAEIMLVSGYSGIGKSALVNEVHKPIVERRGYFISGKFDQFKRNTPYGAMIQALRELMRQLLTESESEIAVWRDKLLQALGTNGRIIVDVIPEVAWITGQQPPVPELPPAESQNRFHLVFQRFIRVFTRKEHPLAIFLDDLQWADPATLKLLQTLTTDPSICHLLLIGAYRDNEVNAAHPLLLMLAEIGKNGARLSNIVLKPLSPAHLNQFIAEALRSSLEEARPLAELILHKTGGNPFFVTQFLKTLHQEKLLAVDGQRGCWGFDLDRVRRMAFTDNVVELMAGKIRKLPPAAQQVTKLAACIGNQFDLETLALVYEKPLRQIAIELWEAVREGLIMPMNPGAQFVARGSLANESKATADETPNAEYKFVHDRVQQAAYALMPEDRQKAVHLQLGRQMLQHSQSHELEERLFDIVNHLNLGSNLIASREEKSELAALNLRAGLKAKSSAAYKPALSYFQAGLSFLEEESWSTHYHQSFALHRERAECEYLCGNFAQAQEGFDLLLRRARSTHERAEIHNLRIIQYENMARYTEAVRAGREGLRLFGIVLPDHDEDKKAAFAAEQQAIQQLIAGRAIAALIDLPEMSDAEMKMSMKLLMTVWAPAYIAGDNLLTALISAMMVRLSLAYGNSEASSYGYVTHAITVGTGLGDYQSGHEFGLLALAVNDKFHEVKLRAKVHHMFSCFVNFWRQPIRTCFAHSKEAYRSGLESGDFVYATYALIHESWHAFFSGQELNQFQRDYGPNVSFLAQIKNHSFAEAQRLLLHWGLCFQGLTAERLSFSDETFDEHAYLQTYAAAPFFATFYYVTKLTVHYLFEDYERAGEMARRAEGVIHALVGTLWMTTLCFYHGLTLAALHAAASPEMRSEYAQKLEKLLTQMKLWADNSPENFLHEYALMAAEQARIAGNPAAAMDYYEQAIKSARAHGFVQHEALAQELCARFWRERGNEKIAAWYLAEAHYGYQQWGARAKVTELERRHPLLLASKRRAAETPFSGGQTSQLTIGRRLESLDLQTVIKAAQAISGEIALPRLLEKLMGIVMENAGAQKGALILQKEGELVIAAEGTVGKNDGKNNGQNPRADESIVLHSAPLATSATLSPAVVNYVRRTGESLVLAHAASDSRFMHDAYVAQHQPQSIFCLPVLHQSKLVGILYLENNLAAGAFTPERIEVMQMLAAQAAIALENAGLYEEMKQEIAERKRAEEALRRALFEVEQLKNRLQAENVYLQEEIRTRQNFEEIVGASAAMQTVFRNIEKVARTDATVLIIGETGTGKELVARAIHSLSMRKDSALITVNCGALPSGLIESELFGHEKGAFTGATAKKKGRFELADGGTIFLDEIGELPLETQVKLLRVLQEQEFERVGAAQTIKVNVRVIAATNRNLDEAVKLGAFRTDLFYRLNIFPIHLPTLRDRRDDLPVLAHHFVSKFSRRLAKKIDSIAPEVLQRLNDYDWPGNVRELANVLERAVILCEGGVLQNEHLGLAPPIHKATAEPATLQQTERAHILRILKETNWVVGGPQGAAKRLGLNRTTLLAKMKKLGIQRSS